MLRIAIRDDEEKIVKQIENFVVEYAKTKNLQIEISAFLSGVALLNSFVSSDIIFLDIDMPLLNGIDVAKKIGERDSHSKIVYITSHKCYMQQAFYVHAFGYMVKPFSEKESTIILDDFVRSIEKQSKQNIVTFKNAKESICLNADEILYFEYCGSKVVKIVMRNKEKCLHCTLREVMEKTEKYGFALSHQSYVVNLLYVKSIRGVEIVMANDDFLPLAQKRMVAFKNAHNQFLQVLL